jgi:CRISPR-associated protein Csb2
MLAIAVDFLLEKSFSGRFEDGDSKRDPEWPPHPARLFRALTSAAFDSPLGSREAETRELLTWLEGQAPPEVHAPAAEPAKSPGVFVPVNDDATGQNAYDLLAQRSRKERRFPATLPEAATVYFVWPKCEPGPEQLTLLGEVMRYVPYLGSSRSLIGMWFTESIPDGLIHWKPSPGGEERMRTVSAGSLHDLEAKAERFAKTGLKAYRPGPGNWTTYTKGETAPQAPVKSSYGEMLVMTLPDALVTLEAALPLCHKMKEAIIKFACEQFGNQTAPDYLTGHIAGSHGEPARRLHICAVPLAHVGSQYADGRILGLGILLPANLSKEERLKCYRVVVEINCLNLLPGRLIRLSPVSLDEARTALSVETWTRPSTAWESITPFVFHRFPKKPGDAVSLIEQACEFAGLPKPLTAVSEPISQLRGVPASSKFRARDSIGGRPQRFHRHVYLEFPTRVSGPLLLGAGQSYGYGFFRPVRARGEKEPRD